jgi:hypothetical protein
MSLPCMQVLLTALDALAPLNLPRVVACYGAVDTPAVVDGIRHLHSNSCYCRRLYCMFFNHAGRPRRPPYHCADP